MVATYECLKISHRGMDRFPAFCYICKHKQRKNKPTRTRRMFMFQLGVKFLMYTWLLNRRFRKQAEAPPAAGVPFDGSLNTGYSLYVLHNCCIHTVIFSKYADTLNTF